MSRSITEHFLEIVIFKSEKEVLIIAANTTTPSLFMVAGG